MHDIKTIIIVVSVACAVVFLVLWIGELRSKGLAATTISNLERSNNELEKKLGVISELNRQLDTTIGELESERDKKYNRLKATIGELQNNRSESSNGINEIERTIANIETTTLDLLDLAGL